MTSIFVKELKKYAYNDLRILLEAESEDKLNLIIKKLKEFGIIKTIKKSDEDIDDLQYADEIIVEVSEDDADICFVFNFVGVVIVGGILLKCYPKYISKNNPTIELKQILKVVDKYNSKEQIIKMYTESDFSGSYNLLAISLYLLKDYYEHGIYKNDKDIIETNGIGSIIWDRTINDTFMLISNNKPYYLELQTKRHKNNDLDFFTRLHQIILTKISRELEKVGVLELFDILPVELLDEEMDDLGDIDYISYKITNELNIEFNTRKQNLLKLFYTYLNKKNSIDDIECLSLYGTQSFNLVWEDVCVEIFDNKLEIELVNIDKDIKYDDVNKKLIDIIEKPKWTYTGNVAFATLIPDMITIYNDGEKKDFIIIDAKYYNPLLEKGIPPQRQPGIESITKQFLYQLAYKKLIDNNNYKVKNAFILPTEKSDIIDKSSVTMDMFTKDPYKLEPILVKFISAIEAYDLYLQNKKYNISDLIGMING